MATISFKNNNHALLKSWLTADQLHFSLQAIELNHSFSFFTKPIN